MKYCIVMPTKTIPAHPGERIADVLEELGLSVAVAAKALGVSRQQLHNVIAARAGVTPEMALRLEKGLGDTAQTWLAMQNDYAPCGVPVPSAHDPHRDQRRGVRGDCPNAPARQRQPREQDRRGGAGQRLIWLDRAVVDSCARCARCGARANRSAMSFCGSRWRDLLQRVNKT
jgi:addiction module HigA family antidote